MYKELSENIYELGKHLEILVNSDNTYSSKLEGQVTNWLYNKAESGEINYIDGKFLGTRDSKNKNIDFVEFDGFNIFRFKYKCVWIIYTT